MQGGVEKAARGWNTLAWRHLLVEAAEVKPAEAVQLMAAVHKRTASWGGGGVEGQVGRAAPLGGIRKGSVATAGGRRGEGETGEVPDAGGGGAGRACRRTAVVAQGTTAMVEARYSGTDADHGRLRGNAS